VIRFADSTEWSMMQSSDAFQITSTITQQLYDANFQSIDSSVNIVTRTKFKQKFKVTSFEVNS